MLSNTIVIFRYIEDKDVFQKFYSKMLSSRLILGASQSMDSEESMIAKLKQACGYEFTSKLSRMFTDVGLSRDLTERFHKDLDKEHIKLEMNMNILVLQAGAWPLQAPSCFNGNDANSPQQKNAQNQVPVVSIPPEFQVCVDHFEKFYSVSHTGRKLTWLYHMASVEVKLTYLDKPYTITMSIQQLSILNCFATTESLTVERISVITGITGDILMKTLRTIVDVGILSVPSKDDIKMETLVTLNQSMTNKRLKFKLPAPQMQKQVEKESEQVNNTVQQDRKYYMECTIVRIMKTRKVLKHTQLVNEVIEQTKARFTPDVNFIKKNIEALIEKMYIQRTDQNDEYQYLA
uniref:CULLIN_2 domain-containing protein n=1 Tax=Steinernema glaseri TaxID=37863 RepID=A0A1I7ZJA8_9BILA